MASTDPSDIDPEQDPAPEISNDLNLAGDPYADDAAEATPAGNRPAQGARQLTAAEAAVLFPEMGIDGQALDGGGPEDPAPVDLAGGGGLELSNSVEPEADQVYRAGEGEWPSLEGAEEELEEQGSSNAYTSPFGEDDDEFASGEPALAGAASGGGKGKWLIAGIALVAAGGGAAVVLPRLASPDSDRSDRGFAPGVELSDSGAPEAIDGRRLIDSLPSAPIEGGGFQPGAPSELDRTGDTPGEVTQTDPGAGATPWMDNLFSGGDETPLEEVDPNTEGLLPEGSTFEVAGLRGESDDEQQTLDTGETPGEESGYVIGFGGTNTLDPFQDDEAVQQELARLLAELNGEQSPMTTEPQVAPISPAEFDELSNSIVAIEVDLQAMLSRFDQARAESALGRSRNAAERAFQRAGTLGSETPENDPSVFVGWAPLERSDVSNSEDPEAFEEAETSESLEGEEIALETDTELTDDNESPVDPLEETVAALESEEQGSTDPSAETPETEAVDQEPMDEGLVEEELADSNSDQTPEMPANAEGSEETTEPWTEIAAEEPASGDDHESVSAIDPAPESESPEADQTALSLGPVPNEADLAAALEELESAEKSSGPERRTQTLGFDEQLLLPETTGGVRFVSAAELEHVWSSSSLPEETIHSERKLLTPAVGLVRIVCTNGEAFDGSLQSVGQGRLTLRVGLGSMTFDSEDVAQIQRMDGRIPQMPHSPVQVGGERVRVETPGGVVIGNVISRNEGRITLMLESGGRITLADEGVQPYSRSRGKVAIGSIPKPEIE